MTGQIRGQLRRIDRVCNHYSLLTAGHANLFAPLLDQGIGRGPVIGLPDHKPVRWLQQCVCSGSGNTCPPSYELGMVLSNELLWHDHRSTLTPLLDKLHDGITVSSNRYCVFEFLCAAIEYLEPLSATLYPPIVLSAPDCKRFD